MSLEMQCKAIVHRLHPTELLATTHGKTGEDVHSPVGGLSLGGHVKPSQALFAFQESSCSSERAPGQPTAFSSTEEDTECLQWPGSLWRADLSGFLF